MQRRPRAHRGVSAVEVMLAVLVIAVVLIPLMTTSQTQERETFLMEFHLTAQERLRSLLELAATQDLPALEKALVARGGPTSGPDDELQIPLGAAPLAGMTVWKRAGSSSSPGADRESLFDEKLWLGRAARLTSDSTSLYRLRAQVKFRLPIDPPNHSGHLVQGVRLVCRPGLSFRVLPPQ